MTSSESSGRSAVRLARTVRVREVRSSNLRAPTINYADSFPDYPRDFVIAAIADFIHYKEAAGRSEHTIADYHSTRKKLMEFFIDDPPFAAITRAQLINFFAWLTKDYVSDPDGVAPRGKKQLSPKTIFNIHTNCSSLWAWACDEEIVERNLLNMGTNALTVRGKGAGRDKKERLE